MIPEKARDWLSLLGVLGAVGFWFFTMYGLPPRVDALEERVRAHEEKLTRQDVKLDIVIDDVKAIKSILMNFHKDK